MKTNETKEARAERLAFAKSLHATFNPPALPYGKPMKMLTCPIHQKFLTFELTCPICPDKTPVLKRVEQPTIVRTLQCKNGHHYVWPVKFNDRTTNLSGETHAGRECPVCGADYFTATPWQLQVGGSLYSIDIGGLIPTKEIP